MATFTLRLLMQLAINPESLLLKYLQSRSGVRFVKRFLVGLGHAFSTKCRVFRLGGVYAYIRSMRSLRSTLIKYSREARAQPCITNQMHINDLTNR